MRGRRSFCHKGQLEVMDDPVHHGIVGEESDDLHRGAALDTGQGIHLKDFSDHLCPAAAGDPRALLLNDDGWMLVHLCLAHLAPVSIGVQAEVTEGDLPLIGNMGSHPGDELQVVPGGCPGKKRDDGTFPQSLCLPRLPGGGGGRGN